MSSCPVLSVLVFENDVVGQKVSFMGKMESIYMSCLFFVLEDYGSRSSSNVEEKRM